MLILDFVESNKGTWKPLKMKQAFLSTKLSFDFGLICQPLFLNQINYIFE